MPEILAGLDELDLNERVSRFRNAHIHERAVVHRHLVESKEEVLQRRRELAQAYLSKQSSSAVIPQQDGFCNIGTSLETDAVCTEALELACGKAAQADNRALEFPVLAKDFAPGSHAVAFATSAAVLSPIVEYFGMLPILFNLFVTRAHNTQLRENSAHFFHIDPEDTCQMKVFLHLTDVDSDCGPLHLLPAHLSAPILEASNYEGIQRLTDKEIEQAVPESVVQVLGPAGTVTYGDTSRCLHFGGRPRAAGKPLREMLLAQYLLPTSPLFPVAKEVTKPIFMDHIPQRSEDDCWNALLGYDLVV